MDLITVIVPVYNAENYLKNCINSILNQTYNQLELLLIDDGSIDLSGKICDEFAKKDARVQVIHTENSGVSTARNIGLKISNGKFIIFVDSDDWLEKNTVEVMIKCYLNFPCELIMSSFNDVGGDFIRPTYLSNKLLVKDQIINQLKNEFYAFSAPWAKMFLKSIIKENNLLFKQHMPYGEDTLFVIEYLNYCNYINMIKYITYNHRIHLRSVSSEYRYHKDMNIYMELIYASINKLLNSSNKDEKENYRIKQAFASKFLSHSLKHYILHSKKRIVLEKAKDLVTFFSDYIKIQDLEVQDFLDKKSLCLLSEYKFNKFINYCLFKNFFFIIKFKLNKILKK